MSTRPDNTHCVVSHIIPLQFIVLPCPIVIIDTQANTKYRSRAREARFYHADLDGNHRAPIGYRLSIIIGFTAGFANLQQNVHRIGRGTYSEDFGA